jgi:hypothetical protein
MEHFTYQTKPQTAMNYNSVPAPAQRKQGYTRKMLSRPTVQAATGGQEDTAEEKIRRILGRARPSLLNQLIAKGDELTQDDMEIIEAVEEHIEEEVKEAAKEETADQLLYVLSKCYIDGCCVHTLRPDITHYTADAPTPCYPGVVSMDPRLRKGYEAYKANPDCSFIEIYERHICVVSRDCSVTVLDE